MTDVAAAGPTLDLPVVPPVSPMLARLARELPVGDYRYEPKWDGFRCLAFRAGDTVELQSRHGRPFTRYFPELVDAIRALPTEHAVLDGEIVVETARGFDFPALMDRLHPAASRVTLLRAETPARFIAFDALATRDDLRERPFSERRATLESLVDGTLDRLALTPVTTDAAIAADWLEAFHGGGVDGVVAKHASLPYRPGVRAMVKVKAQHTVDCVVAGVRIVGEAPVVASLMLGLYDDAGMLHHVGVVASVPSAMRRAWFDELAPLATALEGHPWEHGFLLEGGPMGRLKGAAGRWRPGMSLDWLPVAPVRVAEVAHDQLDGTRFRHPARFVRWRPDREPGSCSLEQLDADVPDLGALLGMSTGG